METTWGHVPISVCSGCRSKIPQTGQLVQQTLTSSQLWRLEVQDQRARHSPTDQGPKLMTSFDSDNLLLGPVSTSRLVGGVGLLHVNLGGDTIQPIVVPYCVLQKT